MKFQSRQVTGKKMPTERKEDHVNDGDPDNPLNRGSNNKSISKPSEKGMKKGKAAKTVPSKGHSPPSPVPSSEAKPPPPPPPTQKGEVCVDFSDPKIQTAMLLGLLAIMAVALWYGFTQGCFRGRRRRSCWLAYDF